MARCPHRREIAGGLACSIIDGHCMPRPILPLYEEEACPCHACEREWSGGPPTRANSAIRQALIEISSASRRRRPAETIPKRSKECRHLLPVLDRLGTNCPRKHSRGCEILGTTTLEDCDDCHRYVADEDAEAKPDNREKLILRSSLCPGDIVVMTAAVREIHRQFPGRYLTDVRTPARELWEHNPFVQPIADSDPDARVIDMHYDRDPYSSVHRSNEHPIHFVECYCQHLANALGLYELRPREFRGSIWLSPSERERPASMPERYWLINAGGKEDFTAKIWPHELYQRVIDLLPGVRFVQVGAGDPGHSHPPLRGAIDLRGKTTHRELVQLVHHSAGCVTGVSYLMHLAAAVERPHGVESLRPCVVIAGGREPAHWEQYPGHVFLHTIGALDCCARGGCWKSRVEPLGDGKEEDRSLCARPMDGAPECMRLIEPVDVARAISRYDR